MVLWSEYFIVTVSEAPGVSQAFAEKVGRLDERVRGKGAALQLLYFT